MQSLNDDNKTLRYTLYHVIICSYQYWCQSYTNNNNSNNNNNRIVVMIPVMIHDIYKPKNYLNVLQNCKTAKLYIFYWHRKNIFCTPKGIKIYLICLCFTTIYITLKYSPAIIDKSGKNVSIQSWNISYNVLIKHSVLHFSSYCMTAISVQCISK